MTIIIIFIVRRGRAKSEVTEPFYTDSARRNNKSKRVIRSKDRCWVLHLSVPSGVVRAAALFCFGQIERCDGLPLEATRSRP